MGLRDASRRVLTSEELSQPFDVFESDYRGLQLRVVASEVVRAQAVTIYDPHSRISGITYAVLEGIASAGPPGVTQLALSKMLGIEARNVFHYVKMLIKIGIVRKCAVLVKNEFRVAPTSTLKLSKWADASISDDIGGDDEAAGAENEEEENEAGPEVVTAMLGYTEMAMLVLKKLNSVQPPILRLNDLQPWLAEKTNLRRGAFKAISRRLIRAKFIERKTAIFTHNHREAKFIVIRLLHMPKSRSEIERLFSSLPSLNTPGAFGPQYVPFKIDFPLEYQIYKLIYDAGKGGVMQGNIKMIGIGTKVIAKRIERLRDSRKCLTSIFESVGRMRTSRLVHIDATDVPLASSSSASSASSATSSKPLTSPSNPALSARMAALESSGGVSRAKSKPASPVASGASKGVKSQSRKSSASEAVDVDASGSDVEGEGEAVGGGVLLKSRGSKHKSRVVTAKYLRRRAFLADLLEKDGVVVLVGLKKRLMEYEASVAAGQGNVDGKYLRALIDGLIASGVADRKNTAVRDELGALKSVELVVHASLLGEDDAKWKSAVRAKSLDELLGRGIVTQPERDEREPLELTAMKSLTAGGKVKDMIISRRKTSSSLWRAAAAAAAAAAADGASGSAMDEDVEYDELEDEDEDVESEVEESDEDSDAEHVQYMDTDEEENVLQQRKERHLQKKKKAQIMRERRRERAAMQQEVSDDDRSAPKARSAKKTVDSGSSDGGTKSTSTPEGRPQHQQQEEDEDEDDSHSAYSAFFMHIAMGMERAKLVRASVLHIWLCHELFGYAQEAEKGEHAEPDPHAHNRYGPIGSLITNNVPDVVYAFQTTKFNQQARTMAVAAPSQTPSSPSPAAPSAPIGTALIPSTIPSIIEPLAPSILLANMFGMRGVPTAIPTHLSVHRHSSTSTTKPENESKPNDSPSEATYAALEALPEEETTVFSIDRAKSRWFQGRVFNLSEMLLKMPLYIYMKTIGVGYDVPGEIVLTDVETGFRRIRDLPQATRSYLLSRSQYLRSLNLIMEALKQLNLVQPSVTLVEEGDTVNDSSGQGLLPSYTLNPIGIIWHQPLQMPDMRERPEERLFLFEFDAKIPRNTGPSNEMTSYWLTLHEEATSFLRDANTLRIEPRKVNTTPSLKSYPLRPGFALAALSSRAWSGYSLKRDTTALLEHWYVVKSEMESPEFAGVDQATPTMIRLAMETNRRVGVVLNYYLELRKKRLRKEQANPSGLYARITTSEGSIFTYTSTNTKRRINSRRSIQEDEDGDEQEMHQVSTASRGSISTTSTAATTPSNSLLSTRAAQTELVPSTSSSSQEGRINIDLSSRSPAASQPGKSSQKQRQTTAYRLGGGVAKSASGVGGGVGARGGVRGGKSSSASSATGSASGRVEEDFSVSQMHRHRYGDDEEEEYDEEVAHGEGGVGASGAGDEAAYWRGYDASKIRPRMRRRLRWSQAQLNELVKLFVSQKAKAGKYLDDISTLIDGVDRAALCRAMNKPWETLESYLRETVSTKKGILAMANKIAKGIREEVSSSAAAMASEAIEASSSTSSWMTQQSPQTQGQIQQQRSTTTTTLPPPPNFKIELPNSIEQFRRHTRIIHTDSSEWPSSTSSSSKEEEEHALHPHNLHQPQSSMHVSDATRAFVSGGSNDVSSMNIFSTRAAQAISANTHNPLLSGHADAPLLFSEVTQRLYWKICFPPSEEHARRLLEASFFSFGPGLSDFASCARTPPSIWLLPNPLDSILSDNIKTILLSDSKLDERHVVARLLTRDDRSQDLCFASLMQRHVLTTIKHTSKKSHLTVMWMQWTKTADAAIEFAQRARNNLDSLNDEASGHLNALKSSSSSSSGAYAPPSDPLAMSQWTQTFDPFSEPPRIAAILQSAQNQELMMSIKVGELKPARRKMKKYLAANASLRQQRRGSSASHSSNVMEITSTSTTGLHSSQGSLTRSNSQVEAGEEEEDNDHVAVSFQWWREHNILNRYVWSPSASMNYAGEMPMDEGVGAVEADDGEKSREVIHLPCLSLTSVVSPGDVKKSKSGVKVAVDRWVIFEEMQRLVMGKDEAFVSLCKSVWSAIEASKSKPMELIPLEKVLMREEKLERMDSVKSSSSPSSCAVPSWSASILLRDAIQALEAGGFIVRLLGEVEEAWVTREKAVIWTVEVASSSSSSGNSGQVLAVEKEENDRNVNAKHRDDDDDDELIAFQPWRNLDGTFNALMFRRLRAHVALLIINAPGISEETLLDQFDIFRPAIAREMLRALEMDGIVHVRYIKFSATSSHNTAEHSFRRLKKEEKKDDENRSANGHDDEDDEFALPATEQEYFVYLRLQWAHIRQPWLLRQQQQQQQQQQEEHTQPHPLLPPNTIVAKCYWPLKDIQLRL